jgi:hypothetical protein
MGEVEQGFSGPPSTLREGKGVIGMWSSQSSNWQLELQVQGQGREIETTHARALPPKWNLGLS